MPQASRAKAPGKQAQRRQGEHERAPEAERAQDAGGQYAPLLAMQRTAGNLAVVEALRGRGSRGRLLDEATRSEMEARFGQGFGQVRVHTDAEAAADAAAVRAKAYTVGSDVVFSKGRYAPDTTEGKRLLAHELAHVVQQGRVGTTTSLAESRPLEAAADRAAAQVVGGSGGTVAVAGAAGPGLMRKPDDHEEETEESPRAEEKRRTQQREQERPVAGKELSQLVQEQAERDLRAQEADYSQSGAKQRSLSRKLDDLERFQLLLKQAGGTQLDKNKRQGAFDELQRTPTRTAGAPQAKHVAGGPQLRGQELRPGKEHYAQPDYSIVKRGEDGSFERLHVNLKSDQIRFRTPAQARATAKAYVEQAIRNSRHLAEGEGIIIDFAHTPSKEAQEAMKAEFFKKGSPVREVRFGSSKHSAANYKPETAQPDSTKTKTSSKSRGAKPRAAKSAASKGASAAKTTGSKATTEPKAALAEAPAVPNAEDAKAPGSKATPSKRAKGGGAKVAEPQAAQGESHPPQSAPQAPVQEMKQPVPQSVRPATTPSAAPEPEGAGSARSAVAEADVEGKSVRQGSAQSTTSPDETQVEKQPSITGRPEAEQDQKSQTRPGGGTSEAEQEAPSNTRIRIGVGKPVEGASYSDEAEHDRKSPAGPTVGPGEVEQEAPPSKRIRVGVGDLHDDEPPSGPGAPAPVRRAMPLPEPARSPAPDTANPGSRNSAIAPTTAPKPRAGGGTTSLAVETDVEVESVRPGQVQPKTSADEPQVEVESSTIRRPEAEHDQKSRARPEIGTGEAEHTRPPGAPGRIGADGPLEGEPHSAAVSAAAARRAMAVPETVRSTPPDLAKLSPPISAKALLPAPMTAEARAARPASPVATTAPTPARAPQPSPSFAEALLPAIAPRAAATPKVTPPSAAPKALTRPSVDPSGMTTASARSAPASPPARTPSGQPARTDAPEGSAGRVPGQTSSVPPHSRGLKALGRANMVLDAISHYQRLAGKEGVSKEEALARAAGTALVNATGGPGLAAAVNLENAYDAHTDAKQGKGEALASAIGSVGGGAVAQKALPSSPTGMLINATNTALRVAGAPKPMTDVSQTVADAVPANFIGAVSTEGARGYYNIGAAIKSGDAKGIDKQVHDIQAGSAGAPLQGYALGTEITADLLSGKSLEASLMNPRFKEGENSSAASIGTQIGDATFQEIEMKTEIIKDIRAGKDPMQAIEAAEAKNKFGYGDHAITKKLGVQVDLASLRHTVKTGRKVGHAAREARTTIATKVASAEKAVEQTKAQAKAAVETAKHLYQDVRAEVKADVVKVADKLESGVTKAADTFGTGLRKVQDWWNK
jgi:hypothetical protein